MSNIAKSFVELIGKTPLLAATRFGKKYGADANIFAKLEYFNPGGSVKDRIAAEMCIRDRLYCIASNRGC